MTKEQAIVKVNEILGEDLTEQFIEQEDHTANTAKMDFLVSNSNNTAVQVEMEYDADADEISYSINKEWAR